MPSKKSKVVERVKQESDGGRYKNSLVMENERIINVSGSFQLGSVCSTLYHISLNSLKCFILYA